MYERPVRFGGEVAGGLLSASTLMVADVVDGCATENERPYLIAQRPPGAGGQVTMMAENARYIKMRSRERYVLCP